MRKQILLACVLLTCLPGLAQSSQDDETAEPENPLQDARMMLPPPMSGVAYATVVGAEERSNFLRTGATVSGGYVWNLNPGSGQANVNEATYLIEPTVAFDRTSTRLHSTVTWNPAFAWYQLPSVVRTTSQGVNADLQWRLAKYVSLRVGENFLRTSTAYGQVAPSFQPQVGGSSAFTSPGILGLYEPQMSNGTIAGLTWQYGRNDMVAGSGSLNTLDFTDPAKAGGFYNTTGVGGSGSWTHRLGMQQYIGGLYQYTTTQAKPVASTQIGTSQVQTNGVFGFYTVYLTARLSLSVQGGGQNVSIIEHPFYPDYHGWKPAGTASLGWQGNHTSFAAKYGRIVTAGGGLLDAYTTDAVEGLGRWQMTRTWTVQLDGSYSRSSNLLPNTWPNAIRNGHGASGTGSIEHRLSSNLLLSGSYSRVNQSWGNIGAAGSNYNTPNSDRVLVSLSYMLSRPVGR